MFSRTVILSKLGSPPPVSSFQRCFPCMWRGGILRKKHTVVFSLSHLLANMIISFFSGMQNKVYSRMPAVFIACARLHSFLSFGLNIGLGELADPWTRWPLLILHFFLRMYNVQSWQTLRHLLLQRLGYPLVPSQSPRVMWCCHNGIYRNGQVLVCTECQSWLLSPGVTMQCSLDRIWALISSGCVQAKGYIISAAIHTSWEVWIRVIAQLYH